jgi:hypothetical protein
MVGDIVYKVDLPDCLDCPDGHGRGEESLQVDVLVGNAV